MTPRGRPLAALPAGIVTTGPPSAVQGGEYSGGVLHLTERAQEVTFEGISSRPVVSLNRSFSAPVNLHFDQPADDIIHIARHDADLFSRWQAINHLAMQDLTAAVKSGTENAAASETLASIIKATLANDSLEPAFRAQVLALPSEADIAREIGSNIDPDRIHAVRDSIIRSKRACAARI